LGTTNCAVAAVINGVPRLLPVSESAGGRGGTGVFPSLVSFAALAHGVGNSARDDAPLVAPNAPARVLIGEAARRLMMRNSHSSFASTKRLIGRTASAEELQALAALEVPYRRAGSGEILLPCPALRRTISPVDISAELVREMVLSSAKLLGRPVSRAVVCVPAYFGKAERASTLTACKLAGISRVSLLREPEAAVLGYALEAQQLLQQQQNTVGGNGNTGGGQQGLAGGGGGGSTGGGAERVMVFDLGGGTFDVSIVDIGGDGREQVLAITFTGIFI